jgi:hypothetical protein
VSALVFACRCLLLGVFAGSAFTKLRSVSARSGFAQSLVAMRLVPVRWSGPVALAVGGTELAVAALLTVPRIGAAAFVAAAALLAVLSAGLVRSLALEVPVACRCFGPSHRPVGPVHLVRNAVLVSVAGTGALAYRASGPLPAAGAALAALVAAVGLLAVLFLDDLVSLFARGVS